MWLSAPLLHEEPYDFFRSTQFALRHRLRRAGFTLRELEWTEGNCGTLAYELWPASDDLPRHPRAYGGGPDGVAMGAMAVPLWGAVLGLTAPFTWLERRHRHVPGAHCKSSCGVAEKPEPATAERP